MATTAATGPVTYEKGTWSEEEHERFLDAMADFISWNDVSGRVGTRSPVQCRSHDQKIQKKMTNARRNGVRATPRVEHRLPSTPAMRASMRAGPAVTRMKLVALPSALKEAINPPHHQSLPREPDFKAMGLVDKLLWTPQHELDSNVMNYAVEKQPFSPPGVEGTQITYPNVNEMMDSNVMEFSSNDPFIDASCDGDQNGDQFDFTDDSMLDFFDDDAPGNPSKTA